MGFPRIRSAEDLAGLVTAIGFLLFFRNPIAGFSVEECTPSELWFSDTADGPWEWKGPAIRFSGGAYGKFFRGKTGFISADWFPDFANYRRGGYDFDACYDDGLARYQDKQLFDTLAGAAPVLSKVLKQEPSRAGTAGLKGFDAILTCL